MEIVSQVATALLILLGIVATGLALSQKHRDAAIWVGFAASVCGCLWFCSWLQDYLWKQDAEENEQSSKIILEPANDPFPDIMVPVKKPDDAPDSAFILSSNEIALVLGDFVVSTPERSFTVIKLYGKDLLRLTTLEGGIVRIWADIWDDDGRLLATLEDSKLRVNKNNTLPVLQPNPHTLIIQNEKKEDVLSLRFLNPRCLKVGGIFKAGGKYPVVISDKDITFGPLVISSGVALHLRGSAIFEWPGTFQNKAYRSSEEMIPASGAQVGMAVNNGAMNVILRNRQGEEFSLLQIGGSDVPAGTELWPAFSLRLREPGSY